MKRCQHYLFLSMAVVGFSGTTPVWSQRVYFQAGPTSRVDAYGNSSPVNQDRRPVSMFQNDIQRQAFRNYQDDARRTNRRGGMMAFALGADAVQLSRARRNQLLSAGSFGTDGLQNAAARSSVGYVYRVPVMQSDKSRALTQIYSRYGGFGRRTGARQASDVSTLFARKYELLQATMLTAPVRRANMLRGGALGRSFSTLNHGPNLPSADIDMTADSYVPGTGMGLDDALMASLDRLYQGAIDRGWRSFKDGDYQLASRAFETASAIDSKSIEPRVAEVFCEVATGAMRTAMVSLSSLTRRTDHPFDRSLDMREKFATNIEARRIVLQTQIAMRANTNNSFFAPTALHALVLWYSGDRTEAARVAELLVRDEVPAALRRWPALMSSLPTPTP